MNLAPIHAGHDYGEAYLRKRKGRYVMEILFSIAFMGLVAYGCVQMEVSLRDSFICLCVPGVWLVLSVVSLVCTNRRIQRLSDDSA